MEGECSRLRLLVRGRVQGVFFRQAARDQARKLGLVGWVRNLPGGEVEIVAEGPRRNLELLASWAGHGPPMALVSGTEAIWSNNTGEFGCFLIR